MSTPLRSNFDVGSSLWAGRRAQWRALGISDEDMEKPKIAIVNTSSDLAICFRHLDGIVAPLKEAIRTAGGLPFEVRTAAPSDFITSAGRGGRYILPTRDLITNDIEVAVEGALLDGMVCLASCDKTTPGQLMAAARLDIPTIAVVCGYQPSGQYSRGHVDIEDVFLGAGRHAAGEISLSELVEMSENAIRGPGVCAGMGTANSMHIVCEALGMTLPGTTPVLANSPRMWDAVRDAGRRVVELVRENLRPRTVLTRAAFRNAVIVALSVSGSINTVKHLQAIAEEAEVDIDVWRLFEELAGEVPLLTAVRPNGERRIEELEAAGGTRAVMKQLEGLLELEAATISGLTVGETLAGVTVHDEEVIRPVTRPLASHPSIVVVRGSLAPEGAIVKLAVEDTRSHRFAGPANIYGSREEAIEGLDQGEIEPGQVVVLRGIGVRGGPGMGMTSAFIFALDGAGLSEKVAVVTDGTLSGLVNRGIVVGEVSPEHATGGPLALVENGDTISIDLDRRTVDLEVPKAELACRRRKLKGATSAERGWLSVYERVVNPLSRGATLGP